MLGPVDTVAPFNSRGPPGLDVVWLSDAPQAGVLRPCSAPEPQNFFTSATTLACPFMPADTPGRLPFPKHHW